jgi:hypothetical protein
MRIKKERLLRRALLHLVSGCLAATVALFLPFLTGSAVLGAASNVAATNHCTNYFPSSYTPDTNCTTSGGGTNGWIPSGSWGQTTSTALRDNNCMYTTGASRGLEVWYGEYPPAYAYSTNLCGGSSVGYQVAGCKLTDPSGVTGRCVTIWHN